MSTYLADYHTHTTYCDGASTVREMAERAHALGFNTLGFSGHGYTSFDTSYCMSEQGTRAYLAEISAVKKEYRGKLEILAGVEADMHGGRPEGDFDYVIGSSHYVKLGGRYHALDCNTDDFSRLLAEGFGGDYEALAESYFRELSRMFEYVDADFIGHFDLVTKYSERLTLPRGERYYKAAFSALDSLIEAKKPFEINIGAMTRGYRTSPYPEERFLAHIRERGGEIIVTGDCHNAENLGKFLDTGIALAKKCGFSYRLVLTEGGFKRIEL